MGRSAILAIRIIADATSAAAEMTKAQRQAMSFGDKLKKAGAVAGASLGAITIGAKQCVNAAADLQQSVGGVETVFGSSAVQMLEWSRQAARSAGLSQNAYNEMATIIGSQLQNMGMSMEDSASKTNELIHLGADLSSMFGGTTTQAVEALSSALKGEMDPIEAYGISLNDATLQAQAASMGLGDLYKAGDRNAKMQAILAAVTEQSGKAVGNFAREADTAQGQQQRMTAAWENAQAALGQALLPALTVGAQKLAEFATWVQQNASWITPLVAVIGAFAGAIVLLNAAWGVYNTVQAIVQATTITTAGAFKLLAGATGIGLLIAIITLLVQNWDIVKAAGAAAAQWISDAWGNAVAWIQSAWGNIVGFFQGLWANIQSAAQSAGGMVSGAWDSACSMVRGVWNGITGFFSGIWNGIVSGVQSVGSRILQPFQNAINGIRNAFNGLVSFVQGIWDRITGIFSGIGNAVRGAIDAIGSILPFSLAANEVAQPVEAAAPVYRMARSIQPYSTVRPSGLAEPRADLARLSTSITRRPVVRLERVEHVTYEVNFNGLVGDGESVVRELRKLERSYDRKRGNV